MNNTEDTQKPKSNNINGSEPKTQEPTQGLTKTNRHLRRRTNRVNYNILDHGDSSDQSEEYEDYIEPDESPVSKPKKLPRKQDKRDKIPFITKTSEDKRKVNSINEFAIKVEEGDNPEEKNDEIDNLVSEIKTRPKVKRPKVIVESQSETIDQVIELSELRTGPVSNSKLLLALIEICMNAKNYGIKLLNKSRIFWDEVYNNKDFENILKNFKAETLRKYWRIISDIGNLPAVITTIKSFEDIINQENAKLLTVIYLIQDFVKGTITSFDLTIKTCRPKKEDSDDDFMLSKKRKNEIANDVLEMENRIKKSKDKDNGVELPVENSSPKKHVSTDKGSKKNIVIMSGNIKSTLLSDADFEKFKSIDEILEGFGKVVKDISKERVLDALVFNSFNLDRAYQFLTKPEDVSGNLFSDIDDYYIKYHQNSELFNKLVEEKGQESVKERERFLKLEK